jgi:two-component system sensor histidine kinase EvgS
MDGYEFARCVREIETNNSAARTTIIACTANALGGEAEKCFAAGMDDYLVKPVQLAELSKKVAHWLPIPDAGATNPKKPRNALNTQPPAPTAAPIDRSILVEIVGGDNEAAGEMLRDFRRANNEDTALLKHAVDNRDMVQVTRAAHRIKGASKIVGANELARVCERIEEAGRINNFKAIETDMEAYYRALDRVNAYLE